jgi:plasmid stabilization system protein ParE
VEWSPRAAREVDETYEYIARGSPKAAAQIKQGLVDAADSLSLFPNRGRRAGRSRELVVVRPFIMRYRVTPGSVIVLRIKPGAQRP